MISPVTKGAPIEGVVRDDFIRFGHAMLESRDLDPLYDVLQALYNLRGYEGEQRLWFTELYLAYYNLPSAVAAFELFPTWHAYDRAGSTDRQALAVYPTGIERRGLRGGKVVNHLNSYCNLVRVTITGANAGTVENAQHNLLSTALNTFDPETNYEQFWNLAQVPWGNGRWAAYKWAELLKTVHGYRLDAPDLRLRECSGPREGLCWLYGLPATATFEEMDEAAWHLKTLCASLGLELDWEQLETLLCNFNSLRKGRYYIGHDIDELQERIESALDAGWLGIGFAHDLVKARVLSLPVAYLGEAQGRWKGVRKELMKAYSEQHLLVNVP